MPFIACGKILLQEMWATGIDWDNLFQENLATKACKWLGELEDLTIIKVPQCLRLGQKEENMLSHKHYTYLWMPHMMLMGLLSTQG